MNGDIRHKLSRFIDNIGSGFHTDALYDKADYTLSFFGLFSNAKTPEMLHTEAGKLAALLPSLRTFERLLQTLEGGHERSLHWDPQLNNELTAQTITLSPTINISRDDTKLLEAIDTLRQELTAKPVRYDLLVNYILKRAAEEGYLEVGIERQLENSRY